uniref:TrbL/VirB6 plasmid conjugal transfer protein n=2 Tax=unclassified Mycobacterium TaxID=2642494 RepID=A0A5Q5BT28_MYCSS
MIVDASRAGAHPERLQRCSEWIRAWSPAVLLRWCGRHRLITTLAAAGLMLLILGAARAWADPGTGSASDGGNVLISWMGIKDSDGVPVSKYTLTLNQGGWDDPASTMFAKVASLSYEVYLCVIATALWLIKFVLDFQWMSLFTVPFQTIGRGVDEAMDRFGLAATAVAVLAIVVVCTVLAGRTAKAFSNIAMGILMIGVAATIFANPLAELVGPDGLLAKGRDTGLEIATSVSDGSMSQQGDGANIDDMVGRLADRFLRSPTQMINFGVVSDSVSRKCREAWSKGINDERGDKLKDDIKGCDSDKGGAMHQKSMGNPVAMLVPIIMCGLLSLFLVAFACYFVWHVVKAAVQAMLFASLAPPAFAIGVIPGGPQTFAWKTVLDCAMAYAAMVIFTAAFGAYNVILDQVFKESTNPIQSIFLTALVLAFGFAVFGPLRRMFDRQRDVMAAKLGGGAAGGRGGAGRMSQLADMARLKNEAAEQFGWNTMRNGKRNPGRIEHEADSSSSSGGSGGAGPDGGGDDGGGPSGPVSVGDPAAGAPTGGHAAGPDNTSGNSDPAEAAPRTGSHRDPQPEPAGARSDNSRTKDTLDAAMRIYRASRGDFGAAGGGGRHAMSEAA